MAKSPEVTTPCIVWPGPPSNPRSGHCQRKVNGRTVLVHRYAWEQVHGPIPDGMCVLHRCDNPPCYNVEHLFLGTQADNTADKMAKGRHRWVSGESHYNAKLTNADVVQIRDLRKGGMAYAAIAGLFGVSRAYIGAIIQGRARCGG